ncbi:pyruvate synthase [Candidatus Woesearchaeota archaeon]|nr:MAG: pyruvate synthase [Candidatus Woesearchaeota archaeon]
MIEIKFIGRGGQGGKTAAYLAAEAAFQGGKDVQAFPEFGPEREGAPVFAYTRISDSPIKLHSGITHPDIVVVIDESLVFELDVCRGLKEGGILILNTKEPTEEMLKRVAKQCQVFYVDASGIALQLLGKNIPNTPMLGALSKVTGVFTLKQLAKVFQEEFGKKLNPELIKKNLKAMERAFNEVKRA